MTGASAQTQPDRPSRRERIDPRVGGNAAARRARKEAKGAASGRPVGRFARRAHNYGRTILWTVRDTFAGEPRRLAIALVLSGLALAAQAIAVLVIYGYGQAIQLDGSLVIPFLGIDWAARTDTAVLLVAVAAFAASLSVAVLLNFISQRLLLAIIRRRLSKAVEALARAARVLPDPRASHASRLLGDLGFTGLSAGATSSSRSAFLVVQTIPALGGALLASGLLFWLEPVLTALLLLVTAAWSAFLYPVSLRVVAFGRDLRRANGVLRRDHGRVSAPPDRWAPADDLALAYTGWLRTRAEIVLVVGIGIAVIVAIAISVMGAEMMSGTQDWPVLIAYVGALQVALNGVFRTIQAVAVVSRRYPQMVRNRNFILDTARLTRPTASTTRGQTIILGETESGALLTATAGERLAVVASDPIQQVQLIALGARDAGGTPIRSARLGRGAAGAADDGSPILFIDARRLSPEAEHSFSDRLLIVVHSTPQSVGEAGETRLLVAERQRMIGFVAIGSAEAATVLDRMTKQAARREERRRDSYLDDDEEA